MEHPTVEVTLVVTGIDLDDESTAELLGHRFPLILWEERPGLTLMTLNVATDAALEETTVVYRELSRALPSLRLVGVHRDLVTASQIAARVGVSREAVRKWSGRSDFPAAFDSVGVDFQRLWAWTQVVQWLQRRRGISMDDALLTLEDMARLEVALTHPTRATTRWQNVAPDATPSAPTTSETTATVVRLKPARTSDASSWATPFGAEKIS